MKRTCLIAYCLLGLVLAVISSRPAAAQQGYYFDNSPIADGVGYPSFQGDLYGGQADMGQPSSGVTRSWQDSESPIRLWLKASVADRGLGYTGHYFTVGAKDRLFEDQLGGRWLSEARLHHSLEDDGGFFSNVGLERVITIGSGADVSLAAWYDYDGDKRGSFAHEFHQVGLTGQFKTHNWDLIGNGYIPVGTSNYALGDPSGGSPFGGNRILLIPGIDSALEGFDAVLRLRPVSLGMVNGSIDFGGYQYQSDLVDSFAGGRVRLGIQMPRGAIVSAEVNHDDRFDTTGVLQAGWLFGANASSRRHQCCSMDRDLESVTRNDHIVRFNQEAVVLRDPLTGAPYNVIHVNNLAAGGGDGSAERPFSSLVDAQNNSNPYDIIAVSYGDGTDRNMNQGIALQDNQRLWGIGRPMIVEGADGTMAYLGGNVSAPRPKISNARGPMVVRMRDNNNVAGLAIDATGGSGILGDYFVDRNDIGGSIRDNEISNGWEYGIVLNLPRGNWALENNRVEDNEFGGIRVLRPEDTNGKLAFSNNFVNNNGIFGGIELQGAPPIARMGAPAMIFTGNTTNGNGGSGLSFSEIHVEERLIEVFDHTANNNLIYGIWAGGTDGNLRIVNTTATNNGFVGLQFQGWRNEPDQNIQILNSDFSNNGGSANILIDVFSDPTVPTATNVVVRGVRSDSSNGAFGLVGSAIGSQSVLNIDLFNPQFTYSFSEILGGIVNLRVH